MNTELANSNYECSNDIVPTKLELLLTDQGLSAVPATTTAQQPSHTTIDLQIQALTSSIAHAGGDVGNGEIDTITSDAARTVGAVVYNATIEGENPEDLVCKNEDNGENVDTMQVDTYKWEAFCDQMYDYLKHRQLPKKNGSSIQKASVNYTLGEDDKIYYSKLSKDGMSVTRLLVVRKYEDKVKICKEIHLSTGKDNLHHRRDKMLELIGKQYYWKGQRRDVCECIVSCEMCSSGLGCKRKSKPPGQARDIRSPAAKLLKLSSSPLPSHSSVAISKSMAQESPKTNLSFLGQIGQKTVADRLSASSKKSPRRSKSVGSNSMAARLGLHSTADNGTASSASSESNKPFQQIFTTINEPSEMNSNVDGPSLSSGGGGEHEGSLGDKESVYRMLFGIPSQKCDSMLPSVIEAMQLALKQTSDPVKLAEACESHMRQTLSLAEDTYTIAIAPSRAAAYIIAVSACILKIDPLSINHRAISRQCLPLAVVHDACCQGNRDTGQLKTCTPLTGAYNWNLGDIASPMDRKMLSMAIRSNRVAGVLYQPFAYMKHCQHISLQEVCSSCHTLVDDVPVIVDGDELKKHTLKGQFEFTSAVKDFFSQGSDIILLPDTEKFQGPPNTCVVVGKSSLLQQVSKNISLLQSQIGIPLTCTQYDLVGTVVAYKMFELGP